MLRSIWRIIERQKLLAVALSAVAVIGAAVIDRSEGPSSPSATPVPNTPEIDESDDVAEGDPSDETDDVVEDVEPPLTMTLSDLERAGDVDYLGSFDGDFGTQSIGDDDFSDGVSMLVYSDGSGIPSLEIQTRGRFSKVSGVVGIDGEAYCINSPAQVSITDDLGRTLWGPQQVTSRSQKRFEVGLEGAIRVNLEQVAVVGPDDCDNGAAQPAWGEMTFRSE